MSFQVINLCMQINKFILLLLKDPNILFVLFSFCSWTLGKHPVWLFLVQWEFIFNTADILMEILYLSFSFFKLLNKITGVLIVALHLEFLHVNNRLLFRLEWRSWRELLHGQRALSSIPNHFLAIRILKGIILHRVFLVTRWLIIRMRPRTLSIDARRTNRIT